MTAFLSLHDAIAEYVHDGATVAMEGFTHLIPFAAGYEIIRQQKRNLCLIRMTPDLIYDQLIGMGCARKLVFSWGGNPGVGRCTGCVTRLSTGGRIRWSWRNTAMLRWPMPTQPERRVCHAQSSGGIKAPI